MGPPNAVLAATGKRGNLFSLLPVMYPERYFLKRGVCLSGVVRLFGPRETSRYLCANNRERPLSACFQKTNTLFGSSLPKSIIKSPTMLFDSPLVIEGNVRLFSRKGGKMGHHLQNLDELAHRDSREEARRRREEKRRKNKKERVSSHKNENSSVDSEKSNFVGDHDEEDFELSVEDEQGNPLLPESKAVRAKMLMVVAFLERSFSTIRGGEATPELFDAVRVSAYGETVPLSGVGQVVIEDPQRATISCYDPALARDVRDAVRDMPGMNLNPYVEEGGSGLVIVPIPRVSAETRKEIVKELGRQAENGRQRIRRIRRNAMDIVKKGKDGKLEGISKDDAFRVGKDIEAVTEEVLAVLNKVVAEKQHSVMDD